MSAGEIDLGKELYVDATKVDANASVDSLTTRFAVEAREALQKHLEELFQEEEDQQTPEPAPPPLEADQEPTGVECPLVTGQRS
jgi:methionyl-tRNA formyltransferase